jgi:hypothetical protein
VRCLVYIDCVDVTIKRPCYWLVFSVRTFINWIGLCKNPHHYYCLFLSPFYNHANGRSGLIWNPIVWFLLILHSAASSWWLPGPHLCRSVVSMGMERTIDWRKSEKGRDEPLLNDCDTYGQVFCHGGEHFGLVAGAKVSVRHFTRRSASIDQRGEEKSERNRSRPPSLCERLVVGKEDQDWEQYLSFEEMRGNRMFRSLFVSFSRCVFFPRSVWNAKSCPFTMMVYVCAQK